MKVLVVGSGGREHAICRSMSLSDRVDRVFCANGNAGIAQIAECVPIMPTDIDGLVRFAGDRAIDMTFVGGEVPLALGIVDRFEADNLPIIGPTMSASRLESSKGFAKEFMDRHGIPTAKFISFETPDAAIRELETGTFGPVELPVVVKADGLAAGKGVVVAPDRATAIEAIVSMEDRVGAQATSSLIIEECMAGPEVSLLMFADGKSFKLMPPTRDHKRIGEGDTGPNTGGMGTFTDSSLLSNDQLKEIVETIIRPTLAGCVNEGFPFRGILFLGLMMTDNGPKVLEYNVRFGDPETQAILVRLETDLVDICNAMRNSRLDKLDIKWRGGSSACVVLASAGYPDKPVTGDLIEGIRDAVAESNVTVFHAGTSTLTDDEYFTAGGRVLGVTATGGDLPAALLTAYSAVEHIDFRGMQFRRDIGK